MRDSASLRARRLAEFSRRGVNGMPLLAIDCLKNMLIAVLIFKILTSSGYSVAALPAALPHSGYKHSSAFRACACTSVQSGCSVAALPTTLLVRRISKSKLFLLALLTSSG